MSADFHTRDEGILLRVLWFPLNLIQWALIVVLTVLSLLAATILLVFGRELPTRVVQPFWGRAFLTIAGCRMELQGGEDLRNDEPHVVISNHNSWLDVPSLMFFPLPLHFIAKDSVRWLPLFGLYVQVAGMILINRGDREKAQASLRQAGRRIAKGLHILAFPEGTRSRDGRLLPFKKGVMVLAIESGVPVVPVILRGTPEALPPGSFAFRPRKLELRIGQSVPTTGMTYEDRNELKAILEASMQQLWEG